MWSTKWVLWYERTHICDREEERGLVTKNRVSLEIYAIWALRSFSKIHYRASVRIFHPKWYYSIVLELCRIQFNDSCFTTSQEKHRKPPLRILNRKWLHSIMLYLCRIVLNCAVTYMFLLHPLQPQSSRPVPLPHNFFNLVENLHFSKILRKHTKLFKNWKFDKIQHFEIESSKKARFWQRFA